MGRLLVRAVVGGILLALVVAVLFSTVFPWFDRTFVNDPTLGALDLGRHSGETAPSDDGGD